MPRSIRFAHLILAACAVLAAVALVARVQLNLASDVATNRLPPMSRLVADIVGR